MIHGPFKLRGTISAFLIILVAILGVSMYITNTDKTVIAAGNNIEIWWPNEGVVLKGSHPLKALVTDRTVDSYNMSWSVDGGGEVAMNTSHADWPHKEALVDFTGWNWKGRGPYSLTFISRDNAGTELGRRTVKIYTENASSVEAPKPIEGVVVEKPIQVTPKPVETSDLEARRVSIWWPTANAVIGGTTPLKAVLEWSDIGAYKMYFSVDGGSKTEMPTNYTDWPHKEVLVNTDKWGEGVHKLTFFGVDSNGNTVAIKNINVTVKKFVATEVAPVVVNTSSGNPLSGLSLHTGSNANVENTIRQWAGSRPNDAKAMGKLLNTAEASWFGNWNSNVEEDARKYTTDAANKGAVPVLVAYNVTNRDCGSYSAGGAGSADGYRSWIDSMARGIGNRKTIIILEPDAIPGLDCLNASGQQERLDLLKYAVDAFKKNGKNIVYIDAGNSNWKSVSETSTRLKSAGIDKADGFSLNVSNFYTTSQNKSFGDEVSKQTGGKHYVIDTSRNGKGSNGEWCNPWGRGLGNLPTTDTGSNLVDAYLWIKKPGESDGTCNGGPSAGVWWPEYALDLVKNN